MEKIYAFFKNIFKKKDKNCKEDEYCAIYLSYLDKYGKDSKKIKKCKNTYTHYCKKYNLIDINKWQQMSKDERIKLLNDINFHNFLNKNKN